MLQSSHVFERVQWDHTVVVYWSDWHWDIHIVGNIRHSRSAVSRMVGGRTLSVGTLCSGDVG
jgi:hypothetical protein